MFKIAKFSSGEWDIKLIERIKNNKAVIHLNWFNEDERDLFLLHLKIATIVHTYGGGVEIEINAPYLPYGRQDRVFEAGQTIPSNLVNYSLLNSYPNVTIRTQGYHSEFHNLKFKNNKHGLYQRDEVYYVFPDRSASKHFNLQSNLKSITLDKTRSAQGITSCIYDSDVKMPLAPNTKFIICDDICAGGRTFIECAKILKQEYGDDIHITLRIYHAFLDRGLEALNEAGIYNIEILNKDSYKYIKNLYPENHYITFVGL